MLDVKVQSFVKKGQVITSSLHRKSLTDIDDIAGLLEHHETGSPIAYLFCICKYNPSLGFVFIRNFVNSVWSVKYVGFACLLSAYRVPAKMIFSRQRLHASMRLSLTAHGTMNHASVYIFHQLVSELNNFLLKEIGILIKTSKL